MALIGALPSLKNPSRSFVDFLVRQRVLKEDFRSIIGSRGFLEIDQYLLSHNLIDRDKLSQLYAEFYKLPFIRLVDRPIKPSVLQLLPEIVAQKYSVIPYDLVGPKLFLAIGDPASLQFRAPSILAHLKHERGLSIELAVVPRGDIEAVFRKLDAPSIIQKGQSIPLNNNTTLTSEFKLTPTVEKEIPPTAPHQNQPPISPPEFIPKPTDSPSPVKSLNKQDLIDEVEPRIKTIDLKKVEIPPNTLNKIPLSVARRYSIIVFDQAEPKSKFEPPMIKMAILNLNDPKTKEIIGFIETKNKVLVDRYQTTAESFQYALGLYESEVEKVGEIKDEIIEKEPAVAPGASKSDHQPVAATSQIEIPKLSEATINANNAQATESNQSGETTKVVGVSEGLVLSSDDIINRPTVGESTVELQRLAKEQENSLESQNLDKLLKGPVLSVEELSKVFRGGVIPEIVAATLFLAIRMKASDVHIEALVNAVRLRFRIDGILHDILSVPHFLHAPLISRIKILAKMKIDEQRIPQDGRFDVIIDNRQVDLRVSTLPTVHGEKIVMRLLDKSQGVLTLEQLGVTGTNFDTLIANVSKPYGIILSTGPTGSGKSTTLYAILNRLSKPGVNIITLEDPVEYELSGVNQSQVKPQIGFTFAEGLRSVLRQDPNIIMVGEIRDLETAAMSTHAALTGHLVLTTLHTNDAAGALPRMINMGVEPFLITSSLNAVVGQRLVRKICDKCREKAVIPHALLETIKQELADLPSGQMKNLNLDQLIFYHGRGCKECSNGYSGRIGIFEVLAMTSQVEELAVKKAPASDIKKAAIANGMITMTQDGLLKALKGITTVDEIMRVTTTHTKELPEVDA
ncbi:MAG: type II/IV secretion system protein [Patescibacteria group bacterium]